MDLSEIKRRLLTEGFAPERKVDEAIKAITTAIRDGGEILYLTPSEYRVLANAGDLIFLARELAGGKVASSTLLATARELMPKLNIQPDPPAASSPPKRTWRCPRCGRVDTVSAVYDAKVCMSCDVRMNEVNASSPPNPASEIGSQIHAAAASSPPTVPPSLPPDYQRLAQTMQKLRDLALAAWIELRETLDVLWLDPPLAGRDLDSSCGD